MALLWSYADGAQKQEKLQTQLQKSALQIVNCGIHIRLETLRKQFQGRYPVIEWPSASAFHSQLKSKLEERVALIPVTFVAYHDDSMGNPFRSISLPAPTPDQVFIVFRVLLEPDKLSHLNAVFLVPSAAQVFNQSGTPLVTGTSRILSFRPEQDQGCQLYAAGLCSACGASTKLKACTGCRLHGYCGPKCQLTLWKRHKKLCRYVQAQCEATLTDHQAANAKAIS